MKLSDRDFKLLILVGIAVVIALPIIVGLKPLSQKTADVEREIQEKTDRYNVLMNIQKNIKFYEENITFLNQEREKLIADFAEGIRRENTIVFLANTEEKLTNEDEGIKFNMDGITFEDTDAIPISDSYLNEETGETVEGLSAVTCISTVSYKGSYESFKELLDYIRDDSGRKEKGRMVVSSMSAKQSELTGLVEGIFVVKQYAVIGGGRELPKAVTPEYERGNDNIFGKPKINGEIPVDEPDAANADGNGGE